MNDFEELTSRAYSDSPSDDPMNVSSGVLPRDVLNLGHRAYREMWFHPRETIRRIVDVNPDFHVNLLLVISGIAKSLDRSSARSACDKYSLELVLTIVVVGGSLGSLLGAWMYSHCIRITGNWMDGRGDYEKIKAALGWSALPTATGLALWIPLLLLFGKSMFTTNGPIFIGNPVLAIIYSAFTSGIAALGIWSITLASNSIAEVQGYASAWKGFANMLMGGLLMVLVVAVVMLMFVLSLDH